MAYNLKTPAGHDMFEMSSLLQKAIRRQDFNLAGYAVGQLYQWYRDYTWRRVLVISAEDCYGIITKEIIALKEADDYVNKGREKGKFETIFIAKAVTLLLYSEKSRDACYFACNLTVANKIKYEDMVVDIEKCSIPDEGLPTYMLDCHTLKGKLAGKTLKDFCEAENNCLVPHHEGIFDGMSWQNIIDYDEEEKKQKKAKKKEETGQMSLFENY